MGGENEKREEEAGSRTFDEAQQQMFANERVTPGATRPPVGTQADPLLPGEPAGEAEEAEGEDR